MSSPSNEEPLGKDTVVTDAEPAFDAANFLAHCSEQAGIYQMFRRDGQTLYIGKAKNLKKRLASYFRKDIEHPRTQALVAKIQRIDVTLTNTETEALILERNLINASRPPYNVIFRDDKSYPYIHLSAHEFPRLSFYRGSKKPSGEYFGPFPNSQAVRESLNLLQKMFKVRQCEDSFFKNRSRPCLQHQIGRCSAPCVDLVESADYTAAVQQSRLFLEGKNDLLGNELLDKMNRAAEQQEYERAAIYRDQIAILRSVQQKQFIEGRRGDLDIIAAAIDAGLSCVHVLYVRNGRILGSRSHYPKPGIAESSAEIIEAFISQHYLDNSEKGFSVPTEIITGTALDNAGELGEALAAVHNRKINLSHEVKAGRKKWLQMGLDTAQQNLKAKINSRQHIEQRFEALQNRLGLDELPQRIECFDISHSSGELTVASCVVFEREGAKKSDYRRFNIDDITGGDDYAAMHQALTRRYTRLKRGEAAMPDILLIDGGKGQVSQALEVLTELQIDEVLVVGVAKGPTRKAGLEILFVGDDTQGITLPSDEPALQLIQQIRDEAHRFAITGHRARRDKKRRSSPLEGIAGVGPKRRSQLLKHFGGWQGVEKASVEELMRVEGISKKVAEDIFAALH